MRKKLKCNQFYLIKLMKNNQHLNFSSAFTRAWNLLMHPKKMYTLGSIKNFEVFS